MKILYDHQIFAIQRFGGVSRYFTELMRSYKKSGAVNFQLALEFSDNSYIKGLSFNNSQGTVPAFDFRGKPFLLLFLNEPHSKKLLAEQNFDIFHPTYYFPYFLKYLSNKPFVLTIHDMIHELFPQCFPRIDRTAEQKRLLAQKAHKIIVVSENTKNDVIKILNIDHRKISVIHHGHTLGQNNNARPPSSSLPVKYLLFVGMRSSYKNFSTFLRAITPLIHDDDELFLICAGGPELNSAETSLIHMLNIDKKVRRLSVDDDSLAWLYQHALAFIFPSLYEGFGFPILEAFACDCPVIASNTSSLPEVAGEAAKFFDPHSESAIRETIKETIYDNSLRAQMIEIGKKRLKLFSWEITAEKTKRLYEGIA